jgi:hypothetical protein
MTFELPRAAHLAPLLLALAAGSIRAQADPQIEGARALYAAETWPKGQIRDGLDLAEIRHRDLKPEPARVDGRLVVVGLADASGETALVVELEVAETMAAAHQRLLAWLAFRSSPEPAPSASKAGWQVGEVAYLGYSGAAPRALSWLAFARGNVAVRVLAAKAAPTAGGADVAALAAQIDRSIAARPALPDDAALPRPAIEKLASARGAVVAGDGVPLEVAVAGPGGGPVQLVWTVGGSGQGYVEAAADGTWVLHATGPGAIELSLDAVGSTGTTARATIEVDVGPRAR